MMNNYDSLRNMPEEEREKRNETCRRCRIREGFARRDWHFDWVDCPYDCRNDLEHYLAEKGEQNE